MSEVGNYHFAAYHPHYKEKLEMILIESAHNLFLLQAPPQLLLFSVLSDCIAKFVIYYPYYKEKLKIIRSIYNFYLLCSNEPVNNPARTSVYAASCLYFGYILGYLGNFSKVSMFACNNCTYIAKQDLVIREKKSSKTFLYLFFYFFQSTSLFFNLTLLKVRLEIFKCLAMLKCALVSKYETSFNLFHTVSTIVFFSDNIAL